MMAVSPLLSAAQIEVGATDIKGGKEGRACEEWRWGREINREIGQETTLLSSKLEFEDKLRVEGLYKEKISSGQNLFPLITHFNFS